MSQQNLKGHEPLEQLKPDDLLAARYRQLLRWATALTRGDISKAEEVVQEFCLYITLVKPDLGEVVNLDGYLYTCLRNIYRSALARASREAMQVVSIEDFDSFAFAISAHPSGDPLQRQNDLRRICAFVVWRKEVAKSASYFILHFFHGYGRQEIADLACLPISGIYNKLKTARGEIKSYLEAPGKLRLVNRDTPPTPDLSWSLLSTGDLFRELRQTILRARSSECLPEETLLANYRSNVSKPISCPLLAHIVSCERCLSLVDRYSQRPTLKDREPLDLFGYSSQGGEELAGAPASFEVMRRSFERRWGRTYEHRPRTLSLALNGQVIAYHDVRSDQNRLSARIEPIERAQFVEVFSEQQVRLALIAVNEPPPEGPSLIIQRVDLSDARWLELSLSFDGFGLHSEVVYFDPALSTSGAEAEGEEAPALWDAMIREQESPSGFLAGLRAAWAGLVTPLRGRVSSPALAWAVSLAVLLGSAGYFSYRHAHPRIDAAQILNESIRLQDAAFRGQTEHQVLHIEESLPSGVTIKQGVVDLWRDNDDSRYIRRLYDLQHRTLAVEWRTKNDKAASWKGTDQAGIADAGVMGKWWDQDLSAQAFARLGDVVPIVRTIEGGYELTKTGTAQSQLVSATLVLDRDLQPVRQTIRVRTNDEIREVRFVQATLERRPSHTVPDAIFHPESEMVSPANRDRRSSARARGLFGNHTAQLAELQIAVLFQLHALDADTGLPIEVVRTPEGRVRISGAVAVDSLRQEIQTNLEGLTGHELIDFRLLSRQELKAFGTAPPRSAPVEAYEVAQPGFAADARVRRMLAAEGLAGERLDAAMAQFSRDALQHAQRSLQHAYALDRLGSSISSDELHTVGFAAQQQWTEMVNDHASRLETELRSLYGQLAGILPGDEKPAFVNQSDMSINDPRQFARIASLLVRQVRQLNRETGDFFTSTGEPMSDANLNASTRTVMDTIPLQQAAEVAAFAARLGRLEKDQRASAQNR